mgnify:CR=1 FL=1
MQYQLTITSTKGDKKTSKVATDIKLYDFEFEIDGKVVAKQAEELLLSSEYKKSLSDKLIPNILAFLTMEIFVSYRVAGLIASIFCLFLIYLVSVQLSMQ